VSEEPLLTVKQRLLVCLVVLLAGGALAWGLLIRKYSCAGSDAAPPACHNLGPIWVVLALTLAVAVRFALSAVRFTSKRGGETGGGDAR
jgi:hypothetical protein